MAVTIIAAGTARVLWATYGTNALKLTLYGTDSSGVAKIADMTTVTGVTLDVLKPDGTRSTWSASIVSATITTLVLRHPFTTADGLNITDTPLTITPLLDVGGFTYPADPFTLRVVA